MNHFFRTLFLAAYLLSLTACLSGCIRFSAEQTYLDVIAFGAADRVVIERYGDNGYNFQPSRLLLLIHDPIFVLVTTVFLALIALVTSVASVCGKKEGCK